MRLLGSRTLRAFACMALIACVTAPAYAQQTTPARPNIVVIVADDVGFTDFAAYGGEARTPNIDALAQRGAQFSRYYSSPLCSPSRAMLLSGMDNHRTGHAALRRRALTLFPGDAIISRPLSDRASVKRS